MVDYTAASGYQTDGSGRRQYVDRNDASGVQGTYLIADDRNMDRNELVNAVLGSGQVLSGINHGQLLLAIQALGNIRPWSQALSGAIGGYWLGAVVVDSSGAYWKSTAAANTTVPGAAGAKWKSLFDGYATSDQLSAEATARSNADSTLAVAITNESTARGAAVSALQTSITTEVTRAQAAEALKANLVGGNAFTGNQVVTGAVYLNNGNRQVFYAPTSGLDPGSYAEILCTDSTALACLMRLVNSGGQTQAYWYLNTNGLITGSAGTVALTSQLPFTDTTRRIQAFTATGTGEATVNFPTAFAAGTTPVVIPVVNRESTAARMAVLENSATNTPAITNTGFTFTPILINGTNNNASTNPWTAQIIAIGSY